MAVDTPLLPEPRERILRALVNGAVRVSLLAGPRPAALAIRRAFAVGGERFRKILNRHAPAGIGVLRDERYGEEPEACLDVVYPEGTSSPLPLFVWVHGGGWVGGSKDELTGYFKILASEGYVVVGANYSRAPEYHYPTPLRQLMQALQHLQANADRYHIDPQRIVLGGDSAGAQIAAQLAVLITTPGYADKVGVAPTVTPQQLRGLVLACGAYDLDLATQTTSVAGQVFMNILTWAYTGDRHFLAHPDSRTWSVTANLTSAFPPSLITVGNADPLAAHSKLLARKLDALGVGTQTVFFDKGHRPRVRHVYQFDLDTGEAQQFLECQRVFLRDRFGSPAPGALGSIAEVNDVRGNPGG